MVGFSRSRSSRIMHRDAFNEMILLNLAGLRVTSYKKVENQTLELRVLGEKDDDYWQDQELHQLACKRMNEMERLWIESDLAEVQLLINNFHLIPNIKANPFIYFDR